MEKSSFAMAKFGLEANAAAPRRDCGFYVKYIFLFTSLIQFLIILGLVLFMVYGNAQAGTDTHLRQLEEQVQSLFGRGAALAAANANLSRALNATAKDRDKLQGLALKVQRELEKCNSSSQAAGGPQVQDLLLQMGFARCQMTLAFINTTCSAEKLQLQRQLDQALITKKSLEDSLQRIQAELGRTTQDRERCQQQLSSASTQGDFSRTELQLQRHECRTIQSDVGDKFPRVSELLKQFRCGDAESELRQIRERMEGIFRRQQERDSKFVWKESCELSVRQCGLNCSREKQELQGRLQGMERREKEALEERKKLQGEKEKVEKELEEKKKGAAAQEELLRERLALCMAAKELPGLRVQAGAPRSGSFPGSYAELLRNPATLGSLGKWNLDELQQMLQVMEQFTATLRNPSG